MRSSRKLEIEGRQGQRLVVDHLDRRAAAPEEHHGAEGGIVRKADDQLAGLRPPHHRLDGDAGHVGLRLKRAARSKISAAAFANRSSVVRSSCTPPISDLCTMSGESILTATVPPSAMMGRAASAASSGVVARMTGAVGNVVSLEERVDLERIEPAAVLFENMGDDGPGRLGVGREIVGQVVRRLHQLFLRLPVAHELNEAPDRVRLGRVMRDRASSKTRAESGSSPIQAAKTGFWR